MTFGSVGVFSDMRDSPLSALESQRALVTPIIRPMRPVHGSFGTWDFFHLRFVILKVLIKPH